MNILVIDDEWPEVYSGKAVRILNVFRLLRGQHTLHFLYIGDQPPKNLHLIKDIFSSVSSLDLSLSGGSWPGRLFNLLRVMPGDYAPWRFRRDFLRVCDNLIRILQEKKIDLIHCFSYFVAQFPASVAGVPKIWDVADSLYLTYVRKITAQGGKRDWKEWLRARMLFNFEHRHIARFDRTIFVSAGDAAVHRRYGSRTVLIPNGVDLDYFSPQRLSEDYPSVIFTGHMSFQPNVAAVMFFVSNILPLVHKEFPQLKFYVVGAQPSLEIQDLQARKGVIVTGFVNDVRPYLSKAMVFVSPMVNGSGIKNKLLQAMAMRKPIISTTLGAEAIDYVPNKDFMIADQPDRFAQELIELLSNREKRDFLAENGRRLVEEKYSWNKAIERYNSIYKIFGIKHNEQGI